MTDLVSATDALLSTLTVAWKANAPAIVSGPAPEIVYEPLESDLKQHPRQTSAPWIRATIRHADGKKVTLNSDPGTGRYRSIGMMTVQIFVPRKDGSSYTMAQQLAGIIGNAFDGKRAGPNADVVITSTATLDKPLDGIWIRYDTKVKFYWDQVK